MTRYQRYLLRLIREKLAELEALIQDWQDEERTYTPAERQLDVRLDRRPGPA